MELSQVVNPGFIRPWHYLVRVPQPWDQVRKIFSWTSWLDDWLTGYSNENISLLNVVFPAGWLAEQSQAGQVWLGGSPQLTQCRKDLLINLIFELSPPHHHHHHHQILWCVVMWSLVWCYVVSSTIPLCDTGCASLADIWHGVTGC